MKKAWSLTKLFINSLYGFSGIVSDLKLAKKSAIKKLAFVILIMMSFSGSVALFVAFNAKMYDLLQPIGLQSLVITLAVILASMLTLVFGLVGTIANYFVEREGDIILSMPLKGWQLLFAKYVSTYVYEGIVSLAVMATGFIVYGVKSGSGPLFYIASVVISLIIPVIPLTIGYFIIIPLMRAGSILRKKDFTMIFTGIIAICFAVGIQYVTQTMVKLTNNSAEMVQKLASKDGIISVVSKVYYPSKWATYGITDFTSTHGFLDFLLFVALSLGIVVVMIITMKHLYETSIVGSQEVTKSRKFNDHELKEKLSGKGQFSALIDREIKLVNREPIYFLNGPLVIILVPLIFGVMIVLQKGELMKTIEQVMKMHNANYYMTLGTAAFAVFLGVSVNLTSTCISREGKAFEILKSMPINPSKYIWAKLSHGMIFAAIAAVLSTAISQYAFHIGLVHVALALMVSILVSMPLLLCGILLELAYPKLIWDNPQKAMKQNMNGVVIILGTMALVGLLGYLMFNFVKTPVNGFAMLITISLVLSILLYQWTMKVGTKRFYSIEL